MIQKASFKPHATLSLDLDNKWSYMKTHGDTGWDSYPTYLPVVVPRVLKLLADYRLKITWFIVGRDADDPRNRECLRSITAAGHEVGNHSYNHEPWLHLYSREQIIDELARTEDAIDAATTHRPIAFRGPGYSASTTVLEVLVKRGYRFDASTFPNYIGPLARAYYFMTAKLSPEQKAERAKLFGRIADGRRPLKPYRWHTDVGSILEIPVTTMPGAKLPIHLSYLLYLGRFSRTAAKQYLRTALWLCERSGVEPSILLHPLDFMGCDDDRDLAFFPAMDRPAAWKLELAADLFEQLQQRFQVLPMLQYADVLDGVRLPTRRPDFATN